MPPKTSTSNKVGDRSGGEAEGGGQGEKVPGLRPEVLRSRWPSAFDEGRSRPFLEGEARRSSSQEALSGPGEPWAGEAPISLEKIAFALKGQCLRLKLCQCVLSLWGALPPSSLAQLLLQCWLPMALLLELIACPCLVLAL